MVLEIRKGRGKQQCNICVSIAFPTENNPTALPTLPQPAALSELLLLADGLGVEMGQVTAELHLVYKELCSIGG